MVHFGGSMLYHVFLNDSTKGIIPCLLKTKLKMAPYSAPGPANRPPEIRQKFVRAAKMIAIRVFGSLCALSPSDRNGLAKISPFSL